MVVSFQYANYLTKMFVQSVIKAQTGTTVSFGIAESAEKMFLFLFNMVTFLFGMIFS